MKTIITALLLGTGLAATNASGASISYYLDQSNALPNGTNYLQVTISDGVAGDINFEVDVLSAAFNVTDPVASNFGMQTFSFNFDNSLSVSASNINNIDPSTWSISEDQNAGGGFGKFDLQLSGTGATRTEILSFSITGVSGDSIYSYALGSTLNPSSGEFFAAHVAGFDLTNGVTSAQFSGSSPVPIPATLWLLGSGLLALSGFTRRRNAR